MSVIQNIRDKYAKVAVIAIALALLGFIMMDAFSSGNNPFANNSTTLGSVNGKKINYVDFANKVKAQEDMAQSQGYEVNDATRQQIIESVWNSEINTVLLQEEIEKLGLGIGKNEINSILFGANPPADLKQGFTDPATGQFNTLAAQQYFNDLRKSGTPEQKAQMNQYLVSLEEQRLAEKYTTLLSNSVYYAKWFLEKQNTDNSLIANVSYVGVPYTAINDSSVKVSDDEIRAYIKEHEDEFEQATEMRSISYVTFNAAPSAADSAAALQQVQAQKEAFATNNDPANFMMQQSSALDFFDGYLAGSKIQVPNKDSILAMPAGSIYGPYLEGSNYVMAKMIDKRQLPDSVKVRHILIGTVNPQTGQPALNDSVASLRADSIAAAIRGGANFDSLETKYSTDQAAHQNKGVMTFSSTDIQGDNFAKEFGQFILFNGKAGDKKVVKTQFGYHYIEILEQKGMEPHYKVAYFAKPIVPSTETDATASNAANQFAGESRDANAFNDNYNKNLKSQGLAKLIATDIKPADYTIPGLGASRELVRAIFEADHGDVLQPVRVGDAYVVATVTEVVKEGELSVGKARSVVEPILRNRKKAAQIKQKIGTVSTLEAVSTALGQPIQNVDSLRFNGERNPALGYELKVLGAAFNPANKGKVVTEALEGQAGVYVLRVNNVGTTPVMTGSIEEQRTMLQMQARQAMMYRPPTETLKESAEIKDNRAKFY
jgi:peptidyl-prolyl cis-trans isomerase D